jgi:beta-glucosidase
MNTPTRRELGKAAATVALGLAAPSAPAGAQDVDARARATEQQMTDDERFSLLQSIMGPHDTLRERDPRLPQGLAMSAGYTPGVARLGVPALQSTDASLGVTNPGYRPDDKGATALPASIVVGASFNPALARASGGVVGREARLRGFNVVLGGGVNLQRDPRNGRNFEYYSEDPWLTAVMGGEAVAGTQAEGVISTLKHYCLNANETNRHWLDAVIDPAALRETDLLAFQIAIENSAPGSIMSAYNKINGAYAGGSHYLLNEVLKGAWAYKGWVMSDWGGTPAWEYALAGLDQESGAQLDRFMYKSEPFGEPLRAACSDGRLPRERLSDMVRRILRSIFALGLDAPRPAPEVDLAHHNEIALQAARQGIVLLKNDGLLPLSADTTAKITVIGGHATEGVPVGTGSSAVLPIGGYAGIVRIGGPHAMGLMRNLYLLPPSPFAALKSLLPQARLEFDPGQSPAEAAMAARRCDVAIVFAIRVEGEGFDIADLTLPWGQDALIEAVASVNPNTIVVLMTGNPVAMPWRDKAKAIAQAWYPGQAGGQAIAEILSGRVNPSGRLPITFPVNLAQTPRPELPGLGTPWGTPTTVRYDEGAEVGYRWYAQNKLTPLYAFGHGLSYTRFAYGEFEVSGGETITASFTVANSGPRAGADVPQLYLVEAVGENRRRLLGFERIELAPGESRRVTLVADPRLLARFDSGAGQWRITAGIYRLALGRSAIELILRADVELPTRLFGA